MRVREDLPLSAAVALKRKIAPALEAAAKARQRAHGGTAPGRAAQVAHGETGRAADQVAKVTGKSRRTMEKAEAIVAAAEADPAKYGHLVEDMDRKGADGAYRRLINIRAAADSGIYRLEDFERGNVLLGRGNSPRCEQPERALENEMFREISAAGLKVRRQVPIETGVIDLLVDTDPPCIVEVKAISDLFTVARAAAQLWRYAQSYPGAQLFVAAPPPILPEAATFLAKLGMRVLQSTRDINGYSGAVGLPAASS